MSQEIQATLNDKGLRFVIYDEDDGLAFRTGQTVDVHLDEAALAHLAEQFAEHFRPPEPVRRLPRSVFDTLPAIYQQLAMKHEFEVYDDGKQSKEKRASALDFLSDLSALAKGIEVNTAEDAAA